MDLILIRGAPGAGKSETAKKLSCFYPKGTLVEIDAIRKMIISVDWTNQKEHINILQASINLILEFVDLQFLPVIVVDTFSGDKIKDFINAIYMVNPKLVIGIFALYATNGELKKRLELRQSGKFKNFEISKNINDEIVKLSSADSFKINTTGIVASDTAKIIFENILLYNKNQD